MLYPHGQRENQRYRGPLETEKFNTGVIDAERNLKEVSKALMRSDDTINHVNEQMNFDGIYKSYTKSKDIFNTNDVTKGVIRHG